MSLHFDLGPDARNLAHAVDQNGRPLDPHVGLAIHAFFQPDAVILAGGSAFVRRKHDRQPVFLAKLVVALRAVLGNADHDRPGSGEVRQSGGEVLCLKGATARVVLGVKVQHDLGRAQC